MSVPGNRLTETNLKAPPDQFRVVKKQPKIGSSDSSAFFLVEDFPERHDAIVRWRNLSLEKRKLGEESICYRVYDDRGRIVDAVGTHITEEERKAQAGKFRIVCGDFFAGGVIRLVADLDDRDRAIDYAKNAYEGPYTGFQVHDDTGAILIPVD